MKIRPLFLFTELYLATEEEAKYMEGIKRQLSVLKALDRFQPGYHLNDFVIHHWNGFWSGKWNMWRNTFLHWRTLIAAITSYDDHLHMKDTTYQEQTQNIICNYLCLFFENGSTPRIYLYPYKVDNVTAQCYDFYTNDQDWTLVNHLDVNTKE